MSSPVRVRRIVGSFLLISLIAAVVGIGLALRRPAPTRWLTFTGHACGPTRESLVVAYPDTWEASEETKHARDFSLVTLTEPQNRVQGAWRIARHGMESFYLTPGIHLNLNHYATPLQTAPQRLKVELTGGWTARFAPRWGALPPSARLFDTPLGPAFEITTPFPPNPRTGALWAQEVREIFILPNQNPPAPKAKSWHTDIVIRSSYPASLGPQRRADMDAVIARLRLTPGTPTASNMAQ